jgi:hypothetical protein
VATDAPGHRLRVKLRFVSFRWRNCTLPAGSPFFLEFKVMVQLRKQRVASRPFAAAAEVLEWKELLSAAAKKDAKPEKPESIKAKNLSGVGHVKATGAGIDNDVEAKASIKASKLVEGQPMTVGLDLGAIAPLPALSASITGNIKSVEKTGDDRKIVFTPNQDSITIKVKTPLGKVTIQVTPVNADVTVNYNVATKALSFSGDFNVVITGALQNQFTATLSFTSVSQS